MQQQQQQLQLQILQLQQLQAAAAAAAASTTSAPPTSSSSSSLSMSSIGSQQQQQHQQQAHSNNNNNSNNNSNLSSSNPKFSPNTTTSTAEHQFSALMMSQLAANASNPSTTTTSSSSSSASSSNNNSSSAAEHLAAAAEFAQRVQQAHLHQQQQQQQQQQHHRSTPSSNNNNKSWQDQHQLSPSPLNSTQVNRWSSPFNPTQNTPFSSSNNPTPVAAHLPMAHNNSSSPHTSMANNRLLAQMSQPMFHTTASTSSSLSNVTATTTSNNSNNSMIAQPSRDFSDNHLTSQSAAALLRLSSGIAAANTTTATTSNAGPSSGSSNVNSKLSTGNNKNTNPSFTNDKQYLSYGGNAGGSSGPTNTANNNNTNTNTLVQPTQQQLNPAHMNNSNNNNSNNNRQHLQWIENLKAAQQLQIETAAKLQSQQQQQQNELNSQCGASDIDNNNKLAFFPYNLMSPFLPGTKKPKKLIPLDSVDGLRQSIYSGEFYTKFEDLAIGILSNQIIVPEFSIIDYIRRDKFNPIEIERIEGVHRRLGLTNILYLLELTQQQQLNMSRIPPVTTNTRVSSSSTLITASLSSSLPITTPAGFISDHNQHQQQFQLNNTGNNLNQQSHSMNRSGSINNIDSSTNAHFQSQYMPTITSSSSLLQCKPDQFHSPNSGKTTPKQSSQSPSDNNPNNRSHQPSNFMNSGGPRLANAHSSSSTSPAFNNASHMNQHPYLTGSPSSFSSMMQVTSQPPLSSSSGTTTTPTQTLTPFQHPHGNFHTRTNHNLAQLSYLQANNNKSPYSRFSPQPTPLQMLPPHQPPPLQPPSSQSSLPPLLSTSGLSSVTNQLPPHLQHLNPLMQQQQLPTPTSAYSGMSNIGSTIQNNLPRPPRSHSTIGGPGLINEPNHHHLSGLNGITSSSTSNNQFRQPPAAHQSSMIKSSLPNRGSPSFPADAPLAHAHSSSVSCGPPVTAHQSSRFAQTPARLQTSTTPQPIPPPPTSLGKFSTLHTHGSSRPPFNLDDRLSSSKNNFNYPGAINNQISPSNRNELAIDPNTGLSIQALLSLKQSGSPSQHYNINANQGPPTSSPSSLLVNSGTGYYPHNSSLTSSTSPRLQQPSSTQAVSAASSSLLSLSDGIVMKVPMGGTTNGPSPLHNIGGNGASPTVVPQMTNFVQDFDGKSINPGLYNPRSQSSLMAAHQKGPIFDASSCLLQTEQSSLPHTGLSTSHSESSLNSLNNSSQSNPYNDIQHKQQPFSLSTSTSAVKFSPQQVSPKRSIITGSGSPASRKSSKKSKSSPNSATFAPMDPKPSSLSPNEPNLLSIDKVTLTPKPNTHFSEVDGTTSCMFDTSAESNLSGQQSMPTSCLDGSIFAENKLQDTNNNSSVVTGHVATDTSMRAQVGPGSSVNTFGATVDQHVAKNQVPVAHIDNKSGTLFADAARASGTKSDDTTTKIEPNNTYDSNKDTSTDASRSLLIEKNNNNDSSASFVSQQNLLNDSNTNKTDAQNPPKSDTASSTSKYQKLYTKKAWLKNYDLEDQSRTLDIKPAISASNIGTSSTTPTNDIKSADTIENNNDENKQTSTSGNTTVQGEMKLNKNNNSKANGSKLPKGTATKLEPKKKTKETNATTIKKTAANSVRSNSRNGASRSINHDNDSEETNASTSGLDDSDGPSSLKSAGDNLKKLRRMPRRKVKVSSDKECQNSSGTKSNTVSPKGTSRKRVKIEKGSTELNLKRKYNSDDDVSRKKTKKVKQEKPSIDDETTDDKETENKKDLKEPFLQIVSCYDIVAKSIRCLECRRVRLSKNEIRATSRSAKANWDDFCRFYAFRKLRHNQHGQVVVAGFSSAKDATEEDKSLWIPNKDKVPRNFTFEGARYILANVGRDFGALYRREITMIDQYSKKGKKVTWKRAVTGLRELCDVCSTTLFNCHFACERCGFVVCIDCYDERGEKRIHLPEESLSGDNSNDTIENGESQSNNTNKKSKKDSFGWIFCPKNEEHSVDKLILTQIIPRDCFKDVYDRLQAFNSINGTIENCLDSLTDKEPPHDDETSWLCNGNLLVLQHSSHQENIELFRQQWLQSKPVLVRGVDEVMKIDMWLPQYFGNKFGEYRSDLVDCRNGDIHRQSMKKYWEDFEPSAVATTKKRPKDENSLTISHPSSHNDGCTIGPSYYSGSALWRLKDWPPGQDFGEILPAHYRDFMNNLPLRQYTSRSGKLNLANRLPLEMLMPDLGPKMYSAYGTTKFPERGTTNLHLDICDAINVMIYVNGANAFKNGSEEFKETYGKIIDECVVDDAMKNEIKEQNLIPGAMWHIFDPMDADKIRLFLDQVCKEQKIKRIKGSDHIHDQTWYLSQTLLDRLQDEHNVKSHAILQCMGDAILIPAGAPHQVKNVQNCIKVANDFVSPENVRYCIQLTGEFRNLPDTHINQEDKLQIRNIIYHSVKESLQYMEMFESKQIDLKKELNDEDEKQKQSS